MDKREHKQRFDSGLKTRREVLGAGYVDKAMAGVDEFSQEFVELLNTYCWNDIWNRPGLETRDRRLLLVGLLAGQGATDVLEIQLGAAHRNGELDAEGMREIVVFLAHYAGWPVAARLNNVVETILSS